MSKILLVNANIGSWEKNSGGRERTISLTEALVKDHDVTALIFSWDQEVVDKNIDGVRFIKVGTEEDVIRRRRVLIQSTAKYNHDLCIELLKGYIVKYKKKLKELADEADLIILDHYSAAPLLEGITDTPIFYNSQNCEIVMAHQLYPNDQQAIELTRKMEATAFSIASAYGYCSEEDLIEINKNYTTNGIGYYVPNGADAVDQAKHSLGLNSKRIFFVGSGHPPNVVAAKKLVSLAIEMPEYTFTICGDSSNGVFGPRDSRPKNIEILGKVDDQKLDELFSTSFAFINPMTQGSGTHLKMMRALSYGIPIISTSIGARGFSEEEIKDTILICDSNPEFKRAIIKLEDEDFYKSIVANTVKAFDKYDWKAVQKSFAESIDEAIRETPKVNPKKIIEKEKVLIYSIVRNNVNSIDRYHDQIKSFVSELNNQYDFYLSIYENDSTDGTKQKLLSKDWSFLSGISIVIEDIGTQLFGSVKRAERVENLAKARNKGILGGGFIDICDYVLMVEGDNTYTSADVEKLLSFKSLEPNFDIVSAVSLRPNGTHYDWWATRTTPIFNTAKSEIPKDYKRRLYEKFYSTSNGLCLYRAKPFQEGVRHGWINEVTQQFDCEMVVLCQEFHKRGYGNIFINYQATSQH